MSRTGVEEKPAWEQVPTSVRGATARALGSPVARAMRIWGGYGPTPTFRVRLADGRRAFFKGTSPESNEFSVDALQREDQIYRELGHLIERWAPRRLGAFEAHGWRVLLLEDLGPKSAPPWTLSLARAVIRAYAPFHQATAGLQPPAWLPQLADWFTGEGWSWAWALNTEKLLSLASLAGAQSDDALRWLEASLPRLRGTAQSMLDPRWHHVLMHCDTRSDNLRFRDGRLFLLDWPHARMGPPEFDLAAFAQSVTAEGGPDPETLVGWYAECAEIQEGALDAAVSSTASFFANHSWEAAIPGLPRLRGWQKQQLAVTLAWAARRLDLPEPAWLSAISP
jgi:hypothetical protein